VRGKTVVLLVPAEAEIVIEGLIDTRSLEPEAPFGESHGYVNLQEYNAFMEVTAITRRHRPILTSFVSQVAPSESSVIRRVAMEPVYLHHLRSVLGIKGVTRVAMHEPLTSLYAVIAIQFARGTPETEIWRALKGTYAPVALPKRQFMENAKAIWERLGLPPLTPQSPWHGYDLGHWPRELERQADMAVRGNYFELGKQLANERRSDVAMNTPVIREEENT